MDNFESKIAVECKDRPGMEMEQNLIPGSQGRVIDAVAAKMKKAGTPVDEETFQAMVEEHLPLASDLATVKSVMREGANSDRLKAAEVSLKLKRRLGGDGMQVTINAGPKGTPEDLQNMLTAVGGLLPKKGAVVVVEEQKQLEEGKDAVPTDAK